MARARPAVLRRLPRLLWRDPDVWLPVATDDAARYPALGDDIRVLHEEVTPAFTEWDRRAQREQNRFRRQQVLLFAGSLLATVLSATQAALSDAVWPGVLVAIVGAFVGAVTYLTRQRGAQIPYLHARLKTEQLRSLYFQYLGHIGEFADSTQRRTALIARVENIKHAAEPHRDK